MIFKSQNEFPLLEKYKEKFLIDENTIFAYNGAVYHNHKFLPPDLIVHEKRHFLQQDEVGLETWVDEYLNDYYKRLLYEFDAYKAQLRSIKDRNERHRVRMDCARQLSSPLYGSIIEFNKALELLLKD